MEDFEEKLLGVARHVAVSCCALLAVLVIAVVMIGLRTFHAPTWEPTPPPVHVQFSTSCPCDCQPPRVTIYDYGQLAPPCATYEDLPEPPPEVPAATPSAKLLTPQHEDRLRAELADLQAKLRDNEAAAAPPATCPAAKECPPRSCVENGCFNPRAVGPPRRLPEKCPQKCPPKKLCSPCRP